MVSPFSWLRDAGQDARLAMRMLLRSPGFTLVAISTLSLAIGAGAAVYSVVDAVLLRPLPYRDAPRLVSVWHRGVQERELAKVFVAYDDGRRYLEARSFESAGMATWAGGIARVLTSHGPAREILAVPVSETFFATLGVQAVMGRTFRAEDRGAGCVLVLSEPFWRKSLNADRGVVGRPLALDGQSCTVLGVMPADFAFYPPLTHAWTLMNSALSPALEKWNVGVFARLRPGVSTAQAQAELTGLYRGVHAGDSRAARFAPLVTSLQDDFTWLASRELRTTLIVLLSAVMLLVLLACVHVANLILVRSGARTREFGIRAALGGGRARLVRQAVIENLMLAAAGAGGGLLLTMAAIAWFRAAPPVQLPATAQVTFNSSVFGFAVAVALAATLMLAWMQVVRVWRADLVESLKVSGRGSVASGGGRRLAQGLLAAEMAFSLLLLAGAGVLIASVVRMGNESMGFRIDDLAVVPVRLPQAQYPNDQARRQFYDRLLERVEGSALVSRLAPYGGGNQTFEVEGEARDRSLPHDVGGHVVSGGYFRTMGVPLLQGRDFDARDRAGAEPVAIVNQALAREYFPNGDALGQRVRLGAGQDATPWMTVVGIAGNEKHTTLMDEMSWVESPVLFQPLAQAMQSSMLVVVRGRVDAAQQAIAALDGRVPISDAETMRQRIGRPLAYPRFRAWLLAVFAGIALTVAGVGLHGVLAQYVAQRTAELGLRMALGASPGDMVWLVMRQGGIPVVVGLVAGVVGVQALGRVLRSLVYGMQAADPVTLAGVAALLLVVASIAALVPAWRASRVDPAVALREE